MHTCCNGIPRQVTNPFFNSSEKRFRALFRLLLQVGMMFMILPAAQTIVPTLVQNVCSANLVKLVLELDFTQFIVMFIAIAGSIVLCTKLLDKRKFSDLGLLEKRKAPAEYLFGFVLAIALVAIMLLIELASGAAHLSAFNFAQLGNTRFIIGILDGLFSCMMIGFQEEFLRFYQIKNLSEGLAGFGKVSKKTAIIAATILASVYFGYLHKDNNAVTLQAILLLVLDGVFLSLIYIMTGRAWLAFGFHAGWDFAEGNLFGFPVSGYPEKYSLLKLEQVGAPMFTGGGFGPDGGLINLVMIVCGTLGILAWINWREKKLALRLDLTEWVTPPNFSRSRLIETSKIVDADGSFTVVESAQPAVEKHSHTI